jgi:hypothetical protein
MNSVFAWLRFFLLGTILLLSACGEGQDTAVLEMYVINSLGEEVEGAEVTLYATREAWRRGEAPVKEPAVTDRTGVVRFVGLADGDYFFDVVKSDTTNWAGRISTNIESVGSFFVNRVFVVIASNQTSRLVARAGKRWQTNSYTVTINSPFGGTITQPLNPCEQDDVYVFYKDNLYAKEDGASRCASTPALVQGTWRLLDNDTRLSLTQTDADGNPVGTARVWTVVQLNPQIMQLTRQVDLSREQKNFNSAP